MRDGDSFNLIAFVKNVVASVHPAKGKNKQLKFSDAVGYLASDN